MTDYGTPSPERIAEINDALAAYEGATTLTERITGYCLCEQLMNSEALMRRMDQSNRIHREMVRIGKDTRVADAESAASPYSKAKWAKTKAAQSNTVQSEAA